MPETLQTIIAIVPVKKAIPEHGSGGINRVHNASSWDYFGLEP